MKYRLLGLGAALLSLCLAVSCGGSSNDTPSTTGAASESPTASATSADATTTPDDQGPVAIVNDEEISREDFDAQFALLEDSYAAQGVALPEGEELVQLQQSVVEQMVQQTLVLQEATSRNIEASADDVEAQYQTIRASFPDEETFNAALASDGLTEADVHGFIADDIKAQTLFDSVIEAAALAPPTDEEIQTFYDQASLQQELPPLEEIRAEVEAELVNQDQNQVLRDFVAQLEAESTIQILL